MRETKRFAMTLLMAVVVLGGCGSRKSTQAQTESEVQKSGKTEEVKEYLYSDFKTIEEWFWDEFVEKTQKLNDAELYGITDDEDIRHSNMINTWNDYAKDILKNSEIKQGQKIIISGYIDSIHEIPEDSEMGMLWPDRRVVFSLKNNVNDDDWDGIRCQSSDTSFLSIKNNSPVKIEGIFMKEGNISEASESLYDCKIIEH